MRSQELNTYVFFLYADRKLMYNLFIRVVVIIFQRCKASKTVPHMVAGQLYRILLVDKETLLPLITYVLLYCKVDPGGKVFPCAGVWGSQKHCVCRWNSRSASMNNLRYTALISRIFSQSVLRLNVDYSNAIWHQI